MIGFIDIYTSLQFRATGNYCTIAVLHVFSSSLHTHYNPQSSLVVSWQRIYHSLTVTSTHT
jgi:hypothetical protein